MMRFMMLSCVTRWQDQKEQKEHAPSNSFRRPIFPYLGEMPRKTPLPTEEVEIGRRVRILREQRGLSRAVFARGLGTDSSTIANVELGRSPLRFGLAIALTASCGTNARWLATGRLPKNYTMGYIGYSSRVALRTPLSKAYPEFLEKNDERIIAEQAAKAGCPIEELEDPMLALQRSHESKRPRFSPDSYEAIEAREQRLTRWAISVLDRLPPPLQEAFLKHVFAASERFFRINQRSIDESPRPTPEPWRMFEMSETEYREMLVELEELRRMDAEKLTPQDLTSPENRTTNDVMPSSLLEDLMANIRASIAVTGGQSALAKELQVDRQRICDWLKGRSKPNGEMALRIAAWVRSHNEKKEPGRVSARPGQKTQKDKSSSNEKAKSDRPKG